MKKRFFSIVLAMAMCLSVFASVSAEDKSATQNGRAGYYVESTIEAIDSGFEAFGIVEKGTSPVEPRYVPCDDPYGHLFQPGLLFGCIPRADGTCYAWKQYTTKCTRCPHYYFDGPEYGRTHITGDHADLCVVPN